MKKQYNSPILEINETVEIVTTSVYTQVTEVETDPSFKGGFGGGTSGAFNV